jgi:hypothetical protein
VEAEHRNRELLVFQKRDSVSILRGRLDLFAATSVYTN